MNNLLSNLITKALNNGLQNNPLMNTYNQLMMGKNGKQKLQTLLNVAKSKGFDIDAKLFTEKDLQLLKIK